MALNNKIMDFVYRKNQCSPNGDDSDDGDYIPSESSGSEEIESSLKDLPKASDDIEMKDSTKKLAENNCGGESPKKVQYCFIQPVF